MEVRDPGKGFDPQELDSGVGFVLSAVQERLKLIGGDVEIQSSVSEGTRVSLSIPASPGSGEQERTDE